MKRFLLSLMVLICSVITSRAQTSIQLRPDGTTGKDALLNSQSPNSNFGNSNDIAAWTWTSSGPTTARSLFQFDLSGIPSNATIASAYLSLYCNTTSAITQLHSGLNSSYLQRVTSSWDEATVKWSNQPATTTTNQVSLAQSTSTTQDYLNINVKDLVVDMMVNPTSSFGFMIKLQTEATYRSIIFASSDHADASRRPMLVVTYIPVAPLPPVGCITMQPNAAAGKDAHVDSRIPLSTNGVGLDLASWSWTYSGAPTIARSLIGFQIPSIPSGSIIYSAKLSMYCNNTSSVTQLNSGGNASYIRRITGAWDENTVTWANQPTVSLSNQILLDSSTSSTQNYENIDVLKLLNDAVLANQTELGMMLMLKTEAGFRSMIMATSDHADSTKRPKLEICYGLPNAVIVQPNGYDTLLSNYPFQIKWQNAGFTGIHIQYTTNDTIWNTIALNVPAGAGTYNWTPGFSSNSCRIRILNAADTSQGDTSDAAFVVLPGPSLTISSPNGNEVYLSGKMTPITWVKSNHPYALQLEYSTDGVVWNMIDSNVSSSSLSYSWLTPGNTTSGKMLMRVTSKKYSWLTDVSDTFFKLRLPPSVSLVQPDGGEYWLTNATQEILWNSSNSTKVKLEYTTNGNDWITIVNGFPNNNSYNWNPPQQFSSTVKVRVSDFDYPEYVDSSSGVFTLTPPPQLHLVSPNGNEIFYAGTQREIVWTAVFSANIKLEYTADNVNWNPIAASIPATAGVYKWNVPNTITTNARMRVSDVLLPSYADTNDAYFWIMPKPVISLTSPNGGENWVAGTIQAISWVSVGVDSVDLSYSSNSGNRISLANGVPAPGFLLNWILPATPLSNCRLWIQSSTDPTIADSSDAFFNITSSIGLAEGMNGKSELLVFPNPSYSGIFTISDDRYDNLKVIDLMGRVVMEQKGGHSLIDLAGNPSGIYFFHFTYPDSKVNKAVKVIIGN